MNSCFDGGLWELLFGWLNRQEVNTSQGGVTETTPGAEGLSVDLTQCQQDRLGDIDKHTLFVPSLSGGGVFCLFPGFIFLVSLIQPHCSKLGEREKQNDSSPQLMGPGPASHSEPTAPLTHLAHLPDLFTASFFLVQS